MKSNRQNIRFLISALLVVFCVTTLTSGCEPLRKKFTRKKKKKDDQEFIPVLDPVDYPDKMVSPEGFYRHHYSLWQVWQRDLLTAYDERSSDKKKLYLVNQMILQLEEMQKAVIESKQVELAKLIKKLQGIAVDFEMPFAVRNNDGMRKSIESIGKKVRLNYRPSDMKESFRPAILENEGS